MKRSLLLLPFVCASALADHRVPETVPRVPASAATLYIPWETPTAAMQPVKWVETKPIRTIDLTSTFIDNFAALPAPPDANGQSPVWAPHFDGGWDSVARRQLGYTWPVLRSQGLKNEQQIYVDKNFGGRGVLPFSVADSVLTIKASHTADGNYNAFRGFGVTSGLLSSHPKHAQKYGYFEISATVPAGPAMLPQFRLAPVSTGLTPRKATIEVMEAPGNLPGQISQGTHWADNAKSLWKTPVPTAATAMHAYGALWLEDRIVFYVDRLAVAQIATKPDQKEAYYMLVNLAIGGDQVQKWLEPAASTLPASLQVDWIAAYTPAKTPCVPTVDHRNVTICQ